MIDEEVRDRVSTLEAVLGEFIVQTNKSLRQMNEDTRVLKKEMSDFKQEMSEFKEELRQDRKTRDADMQTFEEELRQDRKAMNKQWGELANRLGTIAEDIAAPNVRTMAAEHFGCKEIDSYSVRVMRRSQKDRKRLTEFDVVVSCDNYLFINETKSNPQIDYVNDFVKKLQDVFDFLPEYKGKTVVPILSGLHLPEPIVQKLTEEKIYAMALGGETMELLNYEAVRDES